MPLRGIQMKTHKDRREAFPTAGGMPDLQQAGYSR
jgi:hypothetical protein